MQHIFKATQQRIHSKRIFGFDIETYDDNKGFLLASIVGWDNRDRNDKPYSKIFYSKEELIIELKTNNIFRNSQLYATNLSFDFMGTFFGQTDISKFIYCQRNSAMLSVKTWFKGQGVDTEFIASGKSHTKSKKSRKSLEFIDSLNYAQMSVAEMGKILGYEKKKSPVFGLSWKKMSEEEQKYMEEYNLRDSEITYKFMKNIIIPSIEEIGGSVNLTIASSSMSLFKNKYLGDYIVFPNNINILRRLFLGFYGGRTETFARGSFRNAKYYDYNSLYPSVMHDNEYPDPNSQRVSNEDKTNYIIHCEGVSEVLIEIPFMKYPPLPYRHEGKVIFPYGKFRASWSHFELRHAITCGAKILKVYESIYYVRNIRPFKGFVGNLYMKRRDYQKEEVYNPMEKVIKLIMNALFGKFGERFDEKTSTYHKNNVTPEIIEKSIKCDNIGDSDFVNVVENQDPKAHCIPIWSIYVTAYGRVKLHKALVEHNAIYCDTDSLICFDECPTSSKLGELKLEMDVKAGMTIKPKMYALYSKDNKDYVKMKGLSRKYQPHSYKEFSEEFVNNPNRIYKHFTKFREAIRKGDVLPNEIVLQHKKFSLEDNKRQWKGNFLSILKTLQESNPLEIKDGKIQSKVANLKVSSKPTINKGKKSKGEVAPIRKYKNIIITEPNTPIIDEV